LCGALAPPLNYSCVLFIFYFTSSFLKIKQ
jgi:hypothetical protein